MTEIMGLTRGYQPLSFNQNRNHLLQYLPESQNELPTRCMQDSFDDAIIPLSTDYDLQDKYVTYLGYIRLGRIMEDMDFFAVWCALKYLHNPKQPIGEPTPYVIVTVLVDEVQFTQVTPKPNKDIRISGEVTWTGKTSMEITVWLEQNIDGYWQRITCAVFVMVARNSTNTGPAFVNKLVPNGEREIEMYKRAEARASRRKLEKSDSLINKEPTSDEQTLIHDIFIRTVDTTDPLLGRRILPPGCVWLEDTTLTSNIFSHPEDRNFHNKIFGGFLMRQALELGWLTAYCHCKHRPILRYISDISFKQPVNVGSLLRLTGQVVFTEQNFIQVVVHAEVFDPMKSTTTTTNSFHYTFEANNIISSVMPQSYHESMMYIDGKRHFEQAIRNSN
ncbi:hypothetical protein V9T40_009236 [Parthenolecanium corni]|uniref:HotDog ACOT-type domain-containing protein n=1 Tax=Parthenolecanium corni TaxID=536013 RepID=A0AAN9TS51_9HEMI